MGSLGVGGGRGVDRAFGGGLRQGLSLRSVGVGGGGVGRGGVGRGGDRRRGGERGCLLLLGDSGDWGNCELALAGLLYCCSQGGWTWCGGIVRCRWSRWSLYRGACRWLYATSRRSPGERSSGMSVNAEDW